MLQQNSCVMSIQRPRTQARGSSPDGGETGAPIPWSLTPHVLRSFPNRFYLILSRRPGVSCLLLPLMLMRTGLIERPECIFWIAVYGTKLYARCLFHTGQAQSGH